jgi:hypothetical protein
MEDRVRLTADASDYESVMRRAGNTADQFTNRIGKAQSGFVGMFKRSPDMRAERAMSGFVERIVQGDIAGGLMQISSRMTGLGLVTGVAIIAGVAVFKKFEEQIAAADAAAKTLGNTLALPQGVMGAEAISKRFEEVAKQVDDLTAKSQTMGARVGNFLEKFVNPALGTPSKGTGAGTDKEIVSGLREEAGLLDKRAAADAQQLAFKERILGVGEEQAKIEKLNYDLSVKQSAIDTESARFKQELFDKVRAGKLSGDERDKLLAASEQSANARKQTIKDEGDLEIFGIKKKEAATERSVSAQEKFAKLASSGLSPDQEKKLKLAIEMRGLDEQIKTEADPLAKRGLVAQKRIKEHELGMMPGDVSPLSGEWWKRKNAGEFTDVNSALAGAGLNQAQINKFGPGPESMSPRAGEHATGADVVASVDKLRDLMERVWGR